MQQTKQILRSLLYYDHERASDKLQFAQLR